MAQLCAVKQQPRELMKQGFVNGEAADKRMLVERVLP